MSPSVTRLGAVPTFSGGRSRVRFPEAQRPGHRKKSPGNLPNFRDHGRTAERHLMRVVCNKARKHRFAYSSESGYRLSIGQDVGHQPGVDTVRKTLQRWHRRRLIVQFHAPGGHDVLPDGMPCDFGTRVIFVPGSRAFDRALALARRMESEIDPATGRHRPLRMTARLLRWTAQEARAELTRTEHRQRDPRDAGEAEAAAAEFRRLFPFPAAERPPH